MTKQNAICWSCGARWTDGQLSIQCVECDGGAMDRHCLICDGRCDARWQRAVSDSNDSRIGHWAGRCNLPPPEQQEMLRKRQ